MSKIISIKTPIIQTGDEALYSDFASLSLRSRKLTILYEDGFTLVTTVISESEQIIIDTLVKS